MLTAKEARDKGVCRICEKPIPTGPGAPIGWQMEFNERVFPLPRLTLKFGEEFAHTNCLPPMEELKSE